MPIHFSSDDLAQIQARGLTPEQVEAQIERFRKGFSKTKVTDAATIDNGGICCLDDDKMAQYLWEFQRRKAGKSLLKFVPASGAASRMFKDLYAFSGTYFGVSHNFEKEFPSVKEFLENIRSFAFFNDLEKCMASANLDIADYLQRGDYTTVINFLLKEQYLGYGTLPKALLKFHSYGHLQRTPLEEHIVEGAEYARMDNGEVRMHLTVSPEHRALFRKKISEVRRYYEQALGIKLVVSFSEQEHYTDTIAVNEYNEPLRDENGHLIFRPGGHGSLIENLGRCHADVIFIKNIDNVVPDWMKHSTTVYKQALAGMLLKLQEEAHQWMRRLQHPLDEDSLEDCIRFAHKELKIILPIDFENRPADYRQQWLKAKLDRPMRICGMVKNQGEPGGGPFVVRGSDDEESLQIVELAQINVKDPQQQAIVERATHFNPVDIVCSTKDWRGHYYNLRNYIDQETGFITKKSKGADTLKAMEHPGLWNGAMAHWNTIFVEVPLATFNPVKSVNDLLRKEHIGQ